MSRSSLPKRPEIHVTAGDYDRLAALADAAADAFPAVADFLADELDRAQIIEAAAAKGVVQMYSTVTYRDAASGEEHTVSAGLSGGGRHRGRLAVGAGPWSAWR